MVVGRLVVGGYLCALLVGVSLVGVLGGGYLHALELVPWLVSWFVPCWFVCLEVITCMPWLVSWFVPCWFVWLEVITCMP